MTPNVEMTPSKVPSSNGSCSASPSRNSIGGYMCGEIDSGCQQFRGDVHARHHRTAACHVARRPTGSGGDVEHPLPLTRIQSLSGVRSASEMTKLTSS